MPGIAFVWPRVSDALGIVGAASACHSSADVGKAAGKGGISGVLDVNHVQAAATALTAASPHDESEVGARIHDHVVGTVDTAIGGVGRKGQRLARELSQPGHIEHLHPVLPGAV